MELLHDLSGVELTLPPLRRRREDLPLLVTQTLLGGGTEITRVTPALLALAEGDCQGTSTS